MARDRDDRDDDDDDDDDRPARRSRGGGGGGADIPNYLVQSILVTLCCCLPLGVVAIIHAAKVNGLVSQGDLRAAREASEAAKKWSTWGFIIGIVLNLISIAAQVALNMGAK